MFSKNKQNKLRQTKKDEIKRESQLYNYTIIIQLYNCNNINAFCFLAYLFSLGKLAKHIHKKCLCFAFIL